MTHRHAVGVTRRELLQVGYSGLLGCGLAALPARAAAGTGGRPKSVIVVFLTGGAGQLDTFDPKPDAPPEVRGEFGTVATTLPGVRFAEHLPGLAARTDKFAVVRTLAHRENNHLVATHHVLTGHPQPGAFFDKVASRDDWPCYAAGLDHLRPGAGGVPAGVHLPTHLAEGPLTWPGQHAGLLGPKHDPWQLTKDPAAKDVAGDALKVPAGLDVGQLADRRALLARVNRQQGWLAGSADGRKLADGQDRAFQLLTSGRLARAFDLDAEPPAVRDRYGRHPFGQSLLLARRLVEAGVRVVQANMGRAQTWDTHANAFGRLKDHLLPPLDRGVAALVDDLSASGLLADTLVLVVGEFGRTPKVTLQRGQTVPGRDHWAPCFSGLVAGAGVRGGQVVGKSDKVGAYPVTTPYSPDDVGATVYHVLGVDPAAEVRDRVGRPVQLNRGAVMHGLFTGAG